MGAYAEFDRTTGKYHVERTCTESIWSKPLPYDLQPCPKCGTKQGMNGSSQTEPSVHLLYVGCSDTHYGWTVICSKCLYYLMPLKTTPEEAIDEWNTDELAELFD